MSSACLRVFLLGFLALSVHGMATSSPYGTAAPNAAADNTVAGASFDIFSPAGADVGVSSSGSGATTNTSGDLTGLGDLFNFGGGISAAGSSSTGGSSLDQLVSSLFGPQASIPSYDPLNTSSSVGSSGGSSSGSEMLAPGVTLFDMTNLLTSGGSNDTLMGGNNPLDNAIASSSVSSGPGGTGSFADVLSMLNSQGGGSSLPSSSSSFPSPSPTSPFGVGPTSVFGNAGSPNIGLPSGIPTPRPSGSSRSPPNPFMTFMLMNAMGGGEMGEGGLDMILPFLLMRGMNNNNNRPASVAPVMPNPMPPTGPSPGGLGGMDLFGGAGPTDPLAGGSTGATGASGANDLISLLLGGGSAGAISPLSPPTSSSLGASGSGSGGMGLLDAVMGTGGATTGSTGGTASGSALEQMFNSMMPSGTSPGGSLTTRGSTNPMGGFII